MGKKRRSGRDLLIPDPLLLSRLNKYLEVRKDEATIDQNKMVEDLRTNYREYEKKDKTAFRASVFRAYNYILEPLVNPSSLQDNDGDSSVESCYDEEEEIIDSDNFCDDVEVLNTSEPSGKEKNNGNVSYLQNLQFMANSNSRNEKKKGGSDKEGGPKESSPVVDSIDISSDDDEGDNGDNAVSSGAAVVQPTKAAITHPCLPESVITLKRVTKPALVSRIPSASMSPVSISLVERAATPIPVYASPLKRKATTPIFSALKKRKDIQTPQLPKLKLKDFGGYQKIAKNLSSLLEHMGHPEVYCKLGIIPLTGFLLHGPPGSGKTLLAQCIAGELMLPMLKVVGPELVSGISGESEQRIRSLFDSALSLAPCLLFIDEIDAISQPRDSASKDMERRIVAQLLASFDALHERHSEEMVIVVGATNRADSLDPALRRAGRFDREITVGMPDRQTRKDILCLLTDSLRLHPQLDLDAVAAATPGYVGADLKALTTQAAYLAVSRYMKKKEGSESSSTKESPSTSESKELKTSEETSDQKEVDKESSGEPDPNNQNKETEHKNDDEAKSNETVESIEEICDDKPKGIIDGLEGLYIENDDMLEAAKMIQPSAKREGFATVPDVTWDDVGSLDNIREQLTLSIMLPVKYPDEFERLGVTSPSGVLLCGPPGCGKTLLAKAVANEANINFISVKGPELLNMYVGESERAVRQVFQRARNSEPCVIFFDEIDALCPKRSDGSEGGGRSSSRVVNQLLTEMDGVEGGRGGVYMMAATNRPDMLDPAILRPGRFDKVLYVGLPSPSDRALILKALTKNGTKPEFTGEVDLDAVGASDKCSGFSGADLSALVKEASVEALSEYIGNNRTTELKVSNKHINTALSRIRPSVSQQDRERYELLRLLYTPRPPSEDKMEEDD